MTGRERSDEPTVGWRCCAMGRNLAGTWRRLAATTAISRQCYYGWLRRYEANGLDGLKDRPCPAPGL